MNLAKKLTEAPPSLRWHLGALRTRALYRRAFGHLGADYNATYRLALDRRFGIAVPALEAAERSTCRAFHPSACAPETACSG